MKNATLVSIALAILLVGCHRSQPEVHFLLSNRHEGTVNVYLDKDNGKEIPLRDGSFQVEVPAVGVVTAKSLAPLHESQTQSVSYDGGSSVPIIGPNEVADKTYWWPIGQTDIGGETTRLVYVIATPREVSNIDVFAKNENHPY